MHMISPATSQSPTTDPLFKAGGIFFLILEYILTNFFLTPPINFVKAGFKALFPVSSTISDSLLNRSFLFKDFC